MVDVVVDDIVPAVDVEVASRAGGINKVVHDETLVGDGVKEPLGVNPDTIPDVSGFATKDELAGKADKSDIPDTSAFATKDDLADKADKSEIPTVPTKVSEFENDAGYLTEHQDISGKQDKLTAGENITIDEHGVISATGGGGGGGDCLPLTGGTLTGSLTFEWSGQYLATKLVALKGKYYRTDTGTFVYSDVLTLSPNGEITAAGVINSSALYPKTNNGGQIGGPYLKWGSLYTNKINNGADIAIPTTGGTMARIEDITAAVGSIETALAEV